MADEDLEAQMKASMEAEAAAGAPAAPAKTSIVQKILGAKWIIIAVVLGVAVGGGVAFMLTPKPVPVDPTAEQHAGETKNEATNKHGEENKNQEKLGTPPVASEDELPEDGKAGEHGGAPAIFHKLSPIVVNVFEKNSIHYLKLEIVLEIADAKVEEEIGLVKPKLQDRILFLISDRSLREILTPAGKTLLKEDIFNEFSRQLGADRVKKVYFTEFTIQ